MDSASTNQANIIAIDQFFQVWQVRRDTEAARYHQDTLILVYANTYSMRSTEHDERIHGVAFLCIVQQLSSQASLRINEEVDSVLLTWRPRDHHEQMTLQERLEANRGHTWVNILPSINFQGLLKLNADFDYTMVVCEDRPGTVVAENPILEHDATTLQDEHNQV